MPNQKLSSDRHNHMANAIRFLSMDAVQAAKSGHPGMPMGMADVATVLFSQFIKINPADPAWPDRDRFVLSAGHGSMLHYSLNHLLGYADMTIDQLRQFRQIGSITAGHPEYGLASGIETTTGPLGQGLATSVGMALAERLMSARFGVSLVDHRTWVIAGDGCLQEGISHEAIDLAGHLRLGRLTVFWDDNSISIDGGTELSTSTNQLARFRAAGWHVQAVDGHDPDAIAKATEKALANSRPSLIACKTTIGFGAPTLAGSSKTHGAPLGDEEIAGARKALGWPHAPFVVPDDVRADWKQAAERSLDVYQEWQSRYAQSRKARRFNEAIEGIHPQKLWRELKQLRQQFKTSQPKMATRQSSQKTLEVINEATGLTIGGSADLTGSNLTKTEHTKSVSARQFKGRYVYYGIREHGMAAAMNGMALHGGVVPYGGTFLVFADYARGAMRLSALMRQQVIYVMTHDSIGLGEDGPTHQPIEHLAMLRATPNLYVFRPADAVEVAEAWEAALSISDAPSVLSLSRQSTPTLRDESSSLNKSLMGGYVLSETDGKRDVTLIATGTEVALAVSAADQLAEKGMKAAVVSLPCWELFEQQDLAYRHKVLGRAPRVAIEAASSFGWDRYVSDPKGFIGMSSFGESAPAPDLYKHFGITVENIVETVQELTL
ncbi:MAG: transketolase [Candidatus Puniceispirillum sp. TMED52]|nr:transketolase [SAR116 cluster bacterium]OUU43416.1 MAG: transketolase [Candidatus Puniceispirillum sp. TMED52]